MLQDVSRVCSVLITLSGRGNATEGKVRSSKEPASTGDRDPDKEVRIMVLVSPETREEVRGGFPREWYRWSCVPWDADSEADKEAERESTS